MLPASVLLDVLISPFLVYLVLLAGGVRAPGGGEPAGGRRARPGPGPLSAGAA